MTQLQYIRPISLAETNQRNVNQNLYQLTNFVNGNINAINVKTFGALGDGVTDDTAAINGAITNCAANNGGVVFLPAGTYLISNTINLSSGVWLQGAGKGQSILKLNASLGSSVAIQGASLTHIGISDLTLNINNETNGGGIFYNGVTGCFVRRVSIQHMTKFGIVYQNVTNFEISDCDVTLDAAVNTQNEGILVDSVSQNSYGLITKNTLTNTGMEIDGQYIHVTDNSVTGFKFGSGITMGPNAFTNHNFIANNYCAEGVGEDVNSTFCAGFELWSPQSSVVGNAAISNSGNGIMLGGQNMTCVGNVCIDNGQSTAATIGDRCGIFAQFASTSVFQNSNYSVIGGNTLANQSTAATQQYGFGANPSVTAAVLGINAYQSNAQGPFTFQGGASGLTTWNPTVTASSGTLTTVSALQSAYFSDGPLVNFYIEIDITTNGTGANSIRATLPTVIAPNFQGAANGYETGTGNQCYGKLTGGSSFVDIVKSNGTYPGGSGVFIVIQGSYWTQ